MLDKKLVCRYGNFTEAVCRQFGVPGMATFLMEAIMPLAEDTDQTTEVSPEQIEAAHKLWNCYDFEYARSYGPDSAFRKAKECVAQLEEFDPLSLPYNSAEYEEWFGCRIDDPEEKQPWYKAPVVESASSNSKGKWIRKMYAVAGPMTKGLKRDDNWASVYELFEELKAKIPEITFTVGASDGGYSNFGEDHMPRRKTYQIDATTPEGYSIVGQLHCDAAGTVDNPFGSYDMTLILN